MVLHLPPSPPPLILRQHRQNTAAKYGAEVLQILEGRGVEIRAFLMGKIACLHTLAPSCNAKLYYIQGDGLLHPFYTHLLIHRLGGGGGICYYCAAYLFEEMNMQYKPLKRELQKPYFINVIRTYAPVHVQYVLQT
jgi:hypothetical protein